ncbi:membrane protein [Acrocarpospora pleiomorpha]|uniref:Membrane protein n=1 Tax=Acrocarpospora pleiomorpha TaxID=90975 RepID=A0A5M3XGL7_9ACTN|nr:neutral zinc metallopeptidase [Acrocarpospora pleiomorpha]GES19902.1 membrane protein [Acrocarpospora pleiomorpha]
MDFKDDAELDPSQVEDARASGPQPGGGGSMPGCGAMPGCALPIGGKGGCLLVIIGLGAILLLGQPLLNGFSGEYGNQHPPSPRQPQPSGNLADRCKFGADADQSEDCRIVGIVNSIQTYWKQAFAGRGRTYTPARTHLFGGTRTTVSTACGKADSSVGPFYCPADRKVYLDLSFFNELETRFGAQGGPFAQAYVIAHEYGHHVQNLLGTMRRVGNDRQGANSGAVRLELQADCYAGVWAHNALRTGFYTEPFSKRDIDEALSAASAVGDDSIQRRTQGYVTPEGFTHGTSAQREKWFSVGYDSGDPGRCDTFAGRI